MRLNTQIALKYAKINFIPLLPCRARGIEQTFYEFYQTLEPSNDSFRLKNEKFELLKKATKPHFFLLTKYFFQTNIEIYEIN